MEYQIAFLPDLGLTQPISSQPGTRTPNAAPRPKRASTPPGSAQYDPSLVDGAIAVLTTLGGGIVTNALYDLIKGMLVKRGVRKHTRITKVDKPDGTHIMVVVIDEN